MQQSINSNLLLIQKKLPFPLDLIKYGTPAENFHRCSKMLNRRQLTFLISRPCHVMRRRPLAAPGPEQARRNMGKSSPLCADTLSNPIPIKGQITPTINFHISFCNFQQCLCYIDITVQKWMILEHLAKISWYSYWFSEKIVLTEFCFNQVRTNLT